MNPSSIPAPALRHPADRPSPLVRPTELLCVEGLSVAFPSGEGEILAVRDVDLRVGHGEAVALVGESGCGKSQTALALIGLVRAPGRTTARELRFEGRGVNDLSGDELRRLRGAEVGMIFQDPSASLDPVFTVGYQLDEALSSGGGLSRRLRQARAIELLREVGIPDPESRLHAYPSELSGGLRQRVMIAIATACRPKLLIADEPTTALDVTVQAQILALLARLRAQHGTALLLITHDLAVVASNADRVLVMYAGYCVEEAPRDALFDDPLHPYTRALLASMPGSGRTARKARLPAIPGNVPHPARLPSGCPFRDRCARAVDECARALPAWRQLGPQRRVRCCRAGSPP